MTRYSPPRPLTETERQRVAEFAGWMPGLLKSLPSSLWRRYGIDSLGQVAWLGVIRASQNYSPDRGVKFQSYAWRYARGSVLDMHRGARRRVSVWYEMPVEDEVAASEYEEDHRGTGGTALLETWFAPDCREQRRHLDWRTRVLLYLRTVEGMSPAEAAASMGLDEAEAVGLEKEAINRLAVLRGEATGTRCRQLCGRLREPGMQICARCAELKRQQTTSRYEARRAAGICVQGSCRDRAEPGRPYCAECFAAKKAASKRFRDRRAGKTAAA